MTDIEREEIGNSIEKIRGLCAVVADTSTEAETRGRAAGIREIMYLVIDETDKIAEEIGGKEQ